MASLMPAVLHTYDSWNFRVSTGRLNKWLSLVSRHSAAPAARRTTVRQGSGALRSRATQSVTLKVKFMSQVNIRPPTFVMFCNVPELPESYKRYAHTHSPSVCLLWPATHSTVKTRQQGRHDEYPCNRLIIWSQSRGHRRVFCGLSSHL